ncbi:lipoprotein insertase outer membrane protein LolB [Halopseudomonas salegens]|uniref:Outer-membrane lipoprotein LolB n=1 Tax=Halopseudomonas salegens TaxID=1434072 RepID=A0A1H2GMZ5_9GAMM|nr:lipoprotein insertase outer membrane protein LolB [Halopseudomonas salegens]SDU20841.1 outer membrane lipoprotein LolB [Halopseudomonas salegens]
MRLTRLLLLLLATLTVTACSNLHQRESLDIGGDAQAWRAHKASLTSLDNWILHGKIGLRAPEESGSGTLFWLQQQDYYDIRLSGPLGRRATRIQGDRDGVTLEMAGQPTRQAADAEQLLAQSIGWRLPVDNLLWWVRGLPAPDRPSQLQLDTDSRLARLQQDGWTVEYSRYQPVGERQLPQRLQISGYDLLITLVVTNWEPRN